LLNQNEIIMEIFFFIGEKKDFNIKGYVMRKEYCELVFFISIEDGVVLKKVEKISSTL